MSVGPLVDIGKRLKLSPGGSLFAHPVAFWLGFATVTAGVVLHIPMYLDAARMRYRMVGMSPDPEMLVGMALILAGLAAVAYGLIPAPRRRPSESAQVVIDPLDGACLGRAHVAVLVAMSIAVTIDAMKPITLGFVVPGMAKE